MFLFSSPLEQLEINSLLKSREETYQQGFE